MTGREMDEQIAREMGERGWTAGEIARSLRMPRWWAAPFATKKPRPPYVPPIDRPGVREALAEIGTDVPPNMIEIKYGGRVYEMAVKLWLDGVRP